MNKILISSVAAAVLATVSGAALASSAVYVNKADISVPDTDVANQTFPASIPTASPPTTDLRPPLPIRRLP